MKPLIRPKLIAIVGGSGAGKTWLANHLLDMLGQNVARLSLDNFYQDLSHLPPSRRADANFDTPDAIDWLLFERVLRDIVAGRASDTPEYDFATHTRLSRGKLFFPKQMVLVEGLWLLWQPAICELFDLKIYLECSAQLRLERRLARDVAERGRTPDSVRAQFGKTVATMHERYVAPQAKWADIVLQEPPGDAALRELVEILRMELLDAAMPDIVEEAGEKLSLQAA